MLVKVLGIIDLISATAFLMLLFGIHPFLQFILFCSGLLLMKGMFVLTGDVLSVIDLAAALILLLSLLFIPPTIILWIPALLLFAKGFVSFL